MREFSAALGAHLNGEAQTSCACWQLERKDGVIMGFTDHDEALVFDDIVHEALGGIGGSDIENQAGLSPANGEIAGALSSDRIHDDDIAMGRYDDARLRHYLVNWQDVSERALMDTFIIASIKREEGAFRAEIKSIAALTDIAVCRRFLPRCSARLGDASCGVDLSAHTFPATVGGISGDGGITLSTTIAKPDGWFERGVIAIADGNGVIHERSILADRSLDESTRAIELWEPFETVPSTGQSVTLVTGCDKRFSTCRDKFANQLNFRGFPHMPSPEFIATYAANATEMDGGALIEGSQ